MRKYALIDDISIFAQCRRNKGLNPTHINKSLPLLGLTKTISIDRASQSMYYYSTSS